MTSKGQITLPKPIRDELGIHQGSHIRFLVDRRGGFQGEPVLYELEDLWRKADEGRRPKRAMTRAEMEAAKIKRAW